MSWEVFRKGGRRAAFPRVTLCRNGSLTMNLAGAAAVLGVDLADLPDRFRIDLSVIETGLVGIRATECDGAFSMNLSDGTTTYRTLARSFFAWAGLPSDTARRYRLFRSGAQMAFKISDFQDVSRETAWLSPAGIMNRIEDV